MSGRTWQDMPTWLRTAVRAHHHDGGGEDETVSALTARILVDDPEFTSVIVARYVRSLVRAPKPRKRPRADRKRDALLAETARLDAEGLSLREIAERTGVAHGTVARRLAEWQTRVPEMPASIVALSRPGVSQDAGRYASPVHLPAGVTPLRRPA